MIGSLYRCMSWRERVQLRFVQGARPHPPERSSLVIRGHEFEQDAGGGARATLAASADPS